ncbi:MAG: UDP-3-O-acyl-N-acetylglucosamine deacetylase, partial [Bacteroidia bacterium]|nr:UDP-3-O-acyl-N-acetylglucosamine deacetylase [Bacteroidia bacterium]
MYLRQHTLQQSVSISGKGLHTGANSTITFHPAPENHGFKFRRIDLPNQPIIPADVDYVIELARGTTIGIGDAKVNTVEHTLAALTGLQLDNVLIDIDGPEPPALDGSSIEYIKILKTAGI